MNMFSPSRFFQTIPRPLRHSGQWVGNGPTLAVFVPTGPGVPFSRALLAMGSDNWASAWVGEVMDIVRRQVQGPKGFRAPQPRPTGLMKASEWERLRRAGSYLSHWKVPLLIGDLIGDHWPNVFLLDYYNMITYYNIITQFVGITITSRIFHGSPGMCVCAVESLAWILIEPQSTNQYRDDTSFCWSFWRTGIHEEN